MLRVNRSYSIQSVIRFDESWQQIVDSNSIAETRSKLGKFPSTGNALNSKRCSPKFAKDERTPPIPLDRDRQQTFFSRKKAIAAVVLLALGAAAYYFLTPPYRDLFYCSREYCKTHPKRIISRGDGPCICPEWAGSNS